MLLKDHAEVLPVGPRNEKNRNQSGRRLIIVVDSTDRFFLTDSKERSSSTHSLASSCSGFYVCPLPASRLWSLNVVMSLSPGCGFERGGKDRPSYRASHDYCVR